MNALINLVHELRQLLPLTLVGAANGLGSDSNQAYLIIQPQHGLDYRVALPVGSSDWLGLIFQYGVTWTEESGPNETGRFSVFACSPLQFAYETLNNALYWEQRCLGITMPGKLPHCKLVQVSL